MTDHRTGDASTNAQDGTGTGNTGALAHPEQRWRTLFENMAQGVFYQRADSVLIDCNPSLLQILGVTREQFIGRTSLDPEWQVIREDGSPLPGEDHPSMVALRTGKDVRNAIVGVLNPEKASYVWLSITAIPQFRDGDERPFQAFVIVHDITEIRGAEQREKDAMVRLRLAMESAGEGTWEWDHTTGLVTFDAVSSKMMGYEAKLPPKSGTWAVAQIHPDDRAEVDRLYAAYLAGKTDTIATEFRLEKADGDYTWVASAARIVRATPDDTPLLTVGVLRDITKSRQAETALREGRRRLMTLMSNLPGMAYRCANTPAWPMDFVSQGCVALTGYTATELTGASAPDFGDLIHPGDRKLVWNTVQAGVLAGRPFVVEYRLIHRDGSQRWMWEQGRAVESDDTGTAVLEGFISDITARKLAEEEHLRMEAQLRQAQKLESIGTLAGGVAHEINNPINGIMGYADLILKRIDAGTEAATFAEEIKHETKRVADIVRNLLAFARQGGERRGAVHIQEVVQATVSLIRTIIKRDQIELVVDIPEDLPCIRCRPQQIQQVLMNLMTNARDALNERYPKLSPEKTLVVGARSLERAGTPWIRVTVEDHGTGIEPDVRERMLDPFFTTKPGTVGTGLGLSISHGIVQEHGGVLSVESEVGEYTRFHVDLPAGTTPDTDTEMCWEHEPETSVGRGRH
ncbi:MAG: PAS domain S-box protein [Lentisphaerae bacterium]|jgi:PAS domain S-box-containing protein|nr:PAS domain S-box protein [Lentisphaerota bacterium]MBT4819782.1 PAS domain S-box protein [Lentisphaerota bacterium]MBT5606880.1 PAS domain S-box protein [Lentisphaerota bacterium]MBT7058326.1 PAS domain S-box protein [Lentisphaerota bacterium]MBT7843599.1 PAS domain S-box protein [Lentisphaerota bacterium]